MVAALVGCHLPRAAIADRDILDPLAGAEFDRQLIAVRHLQGDDLRGVISDRLDTGIARAGNGARLRARGDWRGEQAAEEQDQPQGTISMPCGRLFDIGA